MTDIDIAAITARAEAATPGPWVQGQIHRESINHSDATRPGYIGDTSRDLNGNYEADATFIAHAREDIPALLAENARLREGRASDAQLCERLAERILVLNGKVPEEQARALAAEAERDAVRAMLLQAVKQLCKSAHSGPWDDCEDCAPYKLAAVGETVTR